MAVDDPGHVLSGSNGIVNRAAQRGAVLQFTQPGCDDRRRWNQNGVRPFAGIIANKMRIRYGD
jgi:hypothetical protein